MLFKTVILHCQQKVQYDRSNTAVFYILKGNPSIQTIQDVHLFHLQQYFGIYKRLTKQQFATIQQGLIKQHFMERKSEQFLMITDKGKRVLEKEKSYKRFFNGYQFFQIDEIYFLRLLLLVQVWTNKQANNTSYIPIVENVAVERWVKSFYKETQHSVSSYLHTLYEELRGILSLLPPIYPQLFIHHMTTDQKIGLTSEQIASQFRLQEEDIHLMTMQLIHFLLDTVSKHSKTYPLLYTITDGLVENKRMATLTYSAKQTNQLIKRGVPLSQIALKRNLKINTVYDHVVEIALHDAYFPIEQYVTKEEQEEIIQAVNNTKSYMLKDIKNTVREEISYFQIRLVLTLMNKGENDERT